MTVPKSKTANAFPTVARSGGAGGIAISEIATWAASTGILYRHIKLLLAFECLVEQCKPVSETIPLGR